MAVNLYDYANQLEQALRDSDEYKAIKDAFAKEIPEEELAKAQEQAQAIEKDENISQLMQAEQKMSQVFQEINQIIVKPLDEIYVD